MTVSSASLYRTKIRVTESSRTDESSKNTLTSVATDSAVITDSARVPSINLTDTSLNIESEAVTVSYKLIIGTGRNVSLAVTLSSSITRTNVETESAIIVVSILVPSINLTDTSLNIESEAVTVSNKLTVNPGIS